jgi:uncharacterized protein YbbC (DUF1343 family)
MKQWATLLVLLMVIITSCGKNNAKEELTDQQIITGAQKINEYLPFLQDKKVGLLINHSSLIQEVHLVDTLLSLGIEIVKIFAPEHGFRGKASAGEAIGNETDEKTGIPIISLYGAQKQVNTEDLKGIDVMVYDIQDVGVRFYTYISTMHYMMQACAESQIPLVVLDRPNPNGHYIDGPLLKTSFKSFVGMHPIPVVYGMTPGEFALMINGESWLEQNFTCELRIVSLDNWDHNTPYSLPVPPSPNLPNDRSIQLYPSLCFFEGTIMSIGRGTAFPFQVYGYPDDEFGEFTFVPESKPGAKRPKHEGKTCYGIDLRKGNGLNNINLDWLIRSYQKYEGDNFFNAYFDKLAGTDQLRLAIKDGKTARQIKEGWFSDIRKFNEIRKKYLLYTDFK